MIFLSGKKNNSYKSYNVKPGQLHFGGTNLILHAPSYIDKHLKFETYCYLIQLPPDTFLLFNFIKFNTGTR
jgi:hypothetical protein